MEEDRTTTINRTLLATTSMTIEVDEVEWIEVEEVTIEAEAAWIEAEAEWIEAEEEWIEAEDVETVEAVEVLFNNSQVRATTITIKEIEETRIS